HPRYEVSAHVDLGNAAEISAVAQAVDSPLSEGATRVENISLGGICIQGGHAEEVGTHVDLVINFPELDAALELRGEVVWANRARPCDMGIRYLDLDSKKRATLELYIERVCSTPKSQS